MQGKICYRTTPFVVSVFGFGVRAAGVWDPSTKIATPA